MRDLAKLTDAALEAALDAATDYRISGPGIAGPGWWIMRHHSMIEECKSEHEATKRLRFHKLAAARRALYSMMPEAETQKGLTPTGASDKEVRAAAATLLADWRRPGSSETWRWESALEWMTMEAEAGRFHDAVGALLVRLAHRNGEPFRWPQPKATPWP